MKDNVLKAHDTPSFVGNGIRNPNGSDAKATKTPKRILRAVIVRFLRDLFHMDMA